MKRLLSVWALGLVAIACADEAATAKKTIQTQMDAFCAAAKVKDGTKMERAVRSAFTENATITPYKGKPIRLDGWILSQKSQLTMLDKIDTISLKITSLKVSGNKGTLKSSFKLTGIVQGPKGTPPMKLQSTGVSEDSIAKVNGTWKITSSKGISSSTLVNGKILK